MEKKRLKIDRSIVRHKMPRPSVRFIDRKKNQMKRACRNVSAVSEL